MAYYTPQVRVYQEFTTTQNSYFEGLSACAVGKLGKLHRYSNLEEKENISLGDYSGAGTFTYPDSTIGSTIDEGYTKLFIDNADLEYKFIDADLTSASLGSADVFGYTSYTTPNALLFNGFSPASNGSYSRDASLGTRDVQIGDKVVLTAHVAGVSDEACTTQTFESKVKDYIVSVGSSSVSVPCRATSVGTTYAVSAIGGSGPVSAGAAYTGSEPEDIYTVTYKGTHTAGYDYSATTRSGRDYQGLTHANGVAESNTPVALTLGKLSCSIPLGDHEAGTTVQIRVTSYTALPADPTRTGSVYDTSTLPLHFDGTYSGIATGNITERAVIRVIAKYSTAGCEGLDLQITTGDTSVVKSTTAGTGTLTDYYVFDVSDGITGCIFIEHDNDKAYFDTVEVGDSWEYDFSGVYAPVRVTASGTYTGNTDETILITCVQGGDLSGTTLPKVTVTTAQGKVLAGETTLSSANKTIVLANGITLTFNLPENGGNTPEIGSVIALGDVWTFTACTGKNAAVAGLVLRDDVPTTFRSPSTSSIIPLAVSLRVVRSFETENFTQDLSNKEISIPAELTVNQDDFVNALAVKDGEMFLEYREWLYSTGVSTVANLSDLDTVPGQLDPDNPLKYGVYKMLTNSNGSPVRYVAVSGDTTEAWSEALAQLSGSTEAYIIVPLTEDIAIMNLVNTLVNSDSNPEACAWKEAIFSKQMTVSQPVALNATGATVLATISKPSGGTKYTQLTVTSDNANFTDIVKPGDLVTIGGADIYAVDRVDSSTRLTLVEGPSTSIYASAPRAITVTHICSKAELVTTYTDWAQSYASCRITCIYPGQVGEAGSILPGYFAACAIAGLRSGVNAWQGLTRVEVAGFDSVQGFENFNVTQLRKLSEGGVWVITEDSDGTPYTLHAVTTNMSELNYQEESVTRNMDSISFALRNVMDTYIGRYNVTESTLVSMRSSLNAALSKMVGSSQVIGYSITQLEQDALLRDTVNCTVRVLLPYAVNVIELHIVAA